MPELREMLKDGAHFGHQKQKWNPKMAPYIFTERNNIHIINLQKTMELIEDAKKFVKELGMAGEMIFLVGTKRQAQEVGLISLALVTENLPGSKTSYKR